MRHSAMMSGYRNALVLTLLLAVGSAAALSQAPPAASPGPLTVTTDSQEYCNDLAARIAAERQARVAVRPEVVSLAEEGQHMCHTGLIRSGLTRLRRALLLLEGHN